MRTETIVRELYQFDELDEKAKDKAREWYREGALDYEWWDCTYEDAKTIGLTITEFDLARCKHVKGTLCLSVQDSIDAIFNNHGPTCDTYKLAIEYRSKLAELPDEEHNEYNNQVEELKYDYTYALCEEYASMLQAEYEYLLSKQVVDETIRANEYEFTKEGKRA